jgi:small multidrug resistance pump
MKIIIIFALAILCEVFATTSLKFSQGFTKLIPSILVFIGYGISFYLLSVSIKVIPIGTAYAIWAGVGIILTTIVGFLIWHEQMDWIKGLGIFLIISGIVLINLFSKTTMH